MPESGTRVTPANVKSIRLDSRSRMLVQQNEIFGRCVVYDVSIRLVPGSNVSGN
jgi:hypothetical protein